MSEQKTHLNCLCGAKAIIDHTSNVGEMADRSGFTPVFTHDGMLWVCSDCKKKLVPAIRTICEVFGLAVDSLSWYALYRSVTRQLTPTQEPGTTTS